MSGTLVAEPCQRRTRCPLVQPRLEEKGVPVISTPPENSEQGKSTSSDETFTTDISETDDEGTTVREAEVNKDDLSEVKPPPTTRHAEVTPAHATRSTSASESGASFRRRSGCQPRASNDGNHAPPAGAPLLAARVLQLRRRLRRL
jgi:hypothetical protein